jgi:hypothetical protein
MLSGFALNVTLFLFLAALIFIAYVTQSDEHPALSTIHLMSVQHVNLTLEEDLLTDDEPLRLMAPLPASVDLYLRSGSSKIPIDDQGRFGSCTAHALRYAWCLWKMKQNPNAPLILPSRCFWYATSRMRLGDAPPLEDFGSTNEATIWALANRGSIAESSYPYNAMNMGREPPAVTLSGGGPNRSNAAVRLSFHRDTNRNILAMKTELSQGKSIIVGIMVYSSFMTSAVMRSGIVPLPNSRRESLMGGHAICITGYSGSFFTFRNSWGSTVGKKGVFQIPQNYLGDWNLTGDAWIL